MATQQIEDPVKRKIAEYALITVSIWIMVVGIYFFKFPNNFSFGGVTGFSSVVSRLTGMNASDFSEHRTSGHGLFIFGNRCWH